MDYTDYSSGAEYTTTELTGAEQAALGGFTIFLLVLSLLALVLTVIAFWKIFTKAGKPGWAALVPFYNLWVLCEVSGRPGWWMVLLLIPFVNIVAAIILGIDLAQRFGKGPVFGVILNFLLNPIGQLILGFSDAKYQAASGTGGSSTATAGTSSPASAPKSPAAADNDKPSAPQA
jgi:hypothetical protein